MYWKINDFFLKSKQSNLQVSYMHYINNDRIHYSMRIALINEQNDKKVNKLKKAQRY